MTLALQMSSAERHILLACAFTGNCFKLMSKKLLLPIQEQGALVYYSSPTRLIDIGINSDIHTLFKLRYTCPDFMVFQNNRYLTNDNKTRYAGCPDLVVEIWSPSNDNYDKAEKFNIYSTSSITEHWYLEQHSNIVECWQGYKSLPSQNIKKVLRTRNGLKFDLRFLEV